MNRRIGERGQALPFIGLCLMVLMGFGAVVVDISYLDYQQQRMQSATDAAAIAGAQQLIAHGCPDRTDAQTAAQNDAQTNNFAPGPNVNVTVDNPPTALDGPYQGNSCAVAVNINVPHTTTWFLKLFGASTGEPITTSAVALEQTKNPGCIYLLNPGATSNFSGATINAGACGILINGKATFTGATIRAQSIGYAAAVPSGGTFPAATPTPMIQTQDVCPEIQSCANIAASPPPITNCQNVTDTTGAALTPGCYNSLTVTNGASLSTGTYVLNGTSSFTNGNLDARTGVTFYVTANASPPNFASTVSGELNPPFSGPYAGVSYYQVPSNTSSPTIEGPINWNGLVYAPGATNANICCLNPSALSKLILVFGGATFTSGSANLITIPASSGEISNVVLVQ